MCHITTIVSGAVSLGVFAGVLSGIFYVALSALKWLGKLRLSLEEEAIKSGRGDRFTTEGFCTNCSGQNGSFGLEEHSERRSSNASGTTPWGNTIRNRGSKKVQASYVENDGLVPSQTEEASDVNTVQIREQIEKLVEKIVGGSLDGVSVGKLSKNACYLAMFVKHHDSLCQGLARLGFALHFSLLNGNGFEQDPPKAAFSALKSSINQIISEAIKLPRISEILQVPDAAEELGNDSDFSNKSYEDILATAILNKIIEQSQKRQDHSNGKKSRRSRAFSTKTENNDGDETDLMYNSDWSDTSRSEQLSLTIEEHIEEVTTTYENSEEEEVNEEISSNSAIPFPESGRTIWNGENSDEEGQEHSSATEIVTSSNSWEENWLFQRKRLRQRPNAHHPVPVPMLVPNPSQDFRALIGGVDADDLSDMSECSDSVLEDVVLAREENEKIVEEVDTELVNGGINFEEAEDVGSPPSLNSESSCPSLSQKERDVSIDYEYFQKMDIELKDRSLPRPRSLDLPNSVAEEVVQLKCQIAEREKEKWNNPVPLPVNPYSPENIKKREQRRKMEYFRTGCHSETSVEFPSDSLRGITKEPSSEIYSRDYYVKASRCPTGDPNIRTSPAIPTEPFLETGAERPGSKEYFDVDEPETLPRRQGSLRDRIAEKTNIMLPNVKELTKKFAQGIEEFSSRPKTDLKRERAPSVKSLTGKEAEYENSSSTLSVNSANLKLSPKSSTISPSSNAALNKMEESGSSENVESTKIGEEIPEGVKEVSKSSSSISKFAGKEVHSLTARSISKEFREELKSNSSRRALPKVDRGSSGESDNFQIASESTRNRSPTPPIDLQSKRKFWEDIISNSQK